MINRKTDNENNTDVLKFNNSNMYLYSIQIILMSKLSIINIQPTTELSKNQNCQQTAYDYLTKN